MMTLRSALIGAALMLAPTAALAQSNFPSPGGATVPLYVQGCLNGSSQAVPCGSTGTPSTVNGTGANNADAVATTATGSVATETFNFVYNGTTWDRWRSINNTQAVGTGTSAVAIAPTSSASGGITSVVSAAAENNHVLKASAGNLYSVYATNLTATAGFLVILNATASPADGAITPLECAPLPANGNASINYSSGPPAVFSTGITAVVTSAATCFTKTTGVITAFIKGSVQ